MMYKGGIFGVIYLFFTIYTATAATVYVPDNYNSIQDAIDAAVPGDTIIVRPGTYTENIDFLGKAITVQSEQGAGITIIDGNQAGSVVTFSNNEGSGSLLQGFTITNGTGTFDPVWVLYFGGGIYCSGSSPTISECTVTGNSADSGGGIFCTAASSPGIDNNTISDNTVTGDGGGIFCDQSSHAAVTNNVITGNQATDLIYSSNGGGIYCFESDMTISGNTISDNSARSNGGGIYCAFHSSTLIERNTISGNVSTNTNGGGGGVYCTSSSPLISKNGIIENSAIYGGGVFVSYQSYPTIIDNVLSENISYYDGGGIKCHFKASMAVINNILADNSSGGFGGGISISDHCTSAVVLNNTVTGNTASEGGGISIRDNSSATVTNTISWTNCAQTGPEIYVGSSPALMNISYSDVEGGQASAHVEAGCTLVWGMGMIDADPLFVAPGLPNSRDYHLTYLSPCKDGGDESAAGMPSEDNEGDPRVVEGDVDMGADEFSVHLYCTGNLTPGGQVEIMIVGIPSTSPAVMALGSGVLDPPQYIPPYGDLYLAPPCQKYWLGSIPANGVLVAAGRIPVQWNAGEEYPVQALVGLELTNLMIMKIE